MDAILSCEFDVCMLDCRLKERNGLELMQEAVSRGVMTPIVFLTGQGDTPRVRELIEKIIPEKSSFDDFEVEHDFPNIGHRRMVLNARMMHDSPLHRRCHVRAEMEKELSRLKNPRHSIRIAPR